MNSVTVWGSSGKKATEMFFGSFFYFCPSFFMQLLDKCWTHSYEFECFWYLLLSLDLRQFYLKSHNSSGHFAWKPACILLASRNWPLNIQWNKSFERAITPQNIWHILSHCIYVNWFGSVLIKMNARTRTVTLCVHFPKNCELRTWTCSFRGSRQSFWIIYFEGTDKLLYRFIKLRLSFSTRLVLQSK